MALQMNKFCFCVPLKFGVITLSLIFLIGGTFATVKYSLDIASGINLFKYAKGSTVSLAALYAFITVGGICGLFIVTCMNTSKMLLDYSKLIFGLIGLDIFFHIKSIIEIVLCKSTILGECVKAIYNRKNSNSLQLENLIDLCVERYNDGLTIIISFGITSIVLLTYFCFMIMSYSSQRKDDEYITGPSGHNRVVPMVGRLANGPNIPPANVANVANATNATNDTNAADGSNVV